MVDDQGSLAGIITRGDVMRSIHEGDAPTRTVLDAASTEVEVGYPEETLEVAIRKMLRRDIGRLPIVEGHGSGKVVGYLGRADILAARRRSHEEEDLREKGPRRQPS